MTIKNLLLFCVCLLLTTCFFSCKKESSKLTGNEQGATKTTDPVDTTSIVGKWTLISDSVTTSGRYTVDGLIPITGNLPAKSNDYFEFDANGDFHEVWYGQVYPYPCTYKVLANNTLITNNAYAPLDSAKIKMTGHKLVIAGTHSISTGSIVSIFYLKR